MVNKITYENYLKAIYHLEEEKKEKTTRIRSIELAEYLNISKPSVSEMLRTLSKKGYTKIDPYSDIKLTKKGRKEAIRLTKNHRIIEVFLSKILRLNPKLIHEEAHKLEHAFSDESIKALNKLIMNPKICPHGKIIPK